MKRFKKRKNSKILKFYLGIVALIFFFTTLFFNLYSKVASNNLVDIAFIKLNEFMESFLSNNINYDLIDSCIEIMNNYYGGIVGIKNLFNV